MKEIKGKYDSSVAENDTKATESKKLKEELNQVHLAKKETESKLEAALKKNQQLQTDKKELVDEMDTKSTSLAELNKKCDELQSVIDNSKE